MEELIIRIRNGDRAALETLILEIQPGIFNLAMRFLSIREDAEDATQEILVKIITNIGRFEGKSRFSTWIYRIAVNHLLNTSKNRLEQQLNFSAFGEDIEHGLRQSDPYYEPDKDLLAEEVKIGCTLGMLLCLGRNLRIAYILGEIFELNSREAAEILDITPENFRKRYSTANQLLQRFMNSWCGLVKKENSCRCHKRINYAISNGRVDKEKNTYVSANTLMRSKQEMDELYTVSAVFKSHPSFEMDTVKNDQIMAILRNLKNITQ
jgi:RNA polymerase sigma factor (sigma-70 family)